MTGRMSALIPIIASLVLPAASGPVVQVGGKSYGKEEIRAVMTSNNLTLPSQAVDKLRQDEVLHSWAVNNGVTPEKAPGEFYRRAFGRDLPADRAGAAAFDLPQIRNQAGSRLHVLEAWLSEASQGVPLRYLDMEGYWDLMKESHAYRIREEHGHAPRLSDMEYTVAELSLTSSRTIATEGSSVFLDGSEFNAFLAENYPEVRATLRRSQTLQEARTRLARRIAREKAILGTLSPGDITWKELEIDRQVEAFIKRNMLREGFSLAGRDFETPSRYLETLQRDFHKTHAPLLKDFREALVRASRKKSGNNSADQYAARVLLEKKRAQIAGSLTDEELFDWMKSEKFPGNRNEAKFSMSHRKMEEIADRALTDRGVVFLALPAE